MADEEIARESIRVKDTQFGNVMEVVLEFDIPPGQLSVDGIDGEQVQPEIGQCGSAQVGIHKRRILTTRIVVGVVPDAPVAGDRDQVIEIVLQRTLGPDQVRPGLVEFELVEGGRNDSLQGEVDQQRQRGDDRQQRQRDFFLQRL